MTFGEKLKKLRDDNNVSQKDFASKFKVSAGTVSNWESDRRFPDKDTLLKIAEFFNVTTDFLLGNSKAETSYKEQSYEEFMESAKAFFMDASPEDQEAIARDISNLYWESRQKDKK